jgi:hypothetical protein
MQVLDFLERRGGEDVIEPILCLLLYGGLVLGLVVERFLGSSLMLLTLLLL